LLAVDPVIFGDAPRLTSPRAVAAALIPYIERELAQGARLHAITRHLLGLFQGVPGARAFRRRLSGAATSPQPGAALLIEALGLVSDENMDDARAAA
jgi:tRNA-dihydrouridine synthase A